MSFSTNFKINGIDLATIAEIRSPSNLGGLTPSQLFYVRDGDNNLRCSLKGTESFASPYTLSTVDVSFSTLFPLGSNFNLLLTIGATNVEALIRNLVISTSTYSWSETWESGSATFSLTAQNGAFGTATNYNIRITSISIAQTITLNGVIYFDLCTLNAPSGYVWANNLVGSKVKVNGVSDTISAVNSRPKMGKPGASATSLMSVGTAGDVYVGFDSGGLYYRTSSKYYLGNCRAFYAELDGAGGSGAGGATWNGGGGSGGGAGGFLVVCIKVPSYVGDFLHISIGYGGATTNGAGNAGGDTILYWVTANGAEQEYCRVKGGAASSVAGYSSNTIAGGGAVISTSSTNYFYTSPSWIGTGGAGGQGCSYGSSSAVNGGGNGAMNFSYYDSSFSFSPNEYSGGTAGTADGGGGGGGSFLSSGASGGTNGGDAPVYGANACGGGGGANKGWFASGNSYGSAGGDGFFAIYY